jgi:hypothetical protein
MRTVARPSVFDYLDADDERRAFDEQLAELERERPPEPWLLRFNPFLLLAALGLLAALALGGLWLRARIEERDLASLPACAAVGPGTDCVAERAAVVVELKHVRPLIQHGERDDVLVRYVDGGTATIAFGVHDADALRPGMRVAVRLHHGTPVAVVGPDRHVFDTADSPRTNRSWARFMAVFFLGASLLAAVVGAAIARRGGARR